MAPIMAGSSFFLSGVMQGKKADGDGVVGTVPQDYRAEMKDAVQAADASATVIEPWDLVGAECATLYPEGTAQADMFKEDAHVRHCFGVCVEAAAKADVIISYLPEASMGSAVEIHAAHGNGKTILVVAPGSMAVRATPCPSIRPRACTHTSPLPLGSCDDAALLLLCAPTLTYHMPRTRVSLPSGSKTGLSDLMPTWSLRASKRWAHGWGARRACRAPGRKSWLAIEKE